MGYKGHYEPPVSRCFAIGFIVLNIILWVASLSYNIFSLVGIVFAIIARRSFKHGDMDKGYARLKIAIISIGIMLIVLIVILESGEADECLTNIFS